MCQYNTFLVNWKNSVLLQLLYIQYFAFSEEESTHCLYPPQHGANYLWSPVPSQLSIIHHHNNIRILLMVFFYKEYPFLHTNVMSTHRALSLKSNAKHMMKYVRHLSHQITTCQYQHQHQQTINFNDCYILSTIWYYIEL